MKYSIAKIRARTAYTAQEAASLLGVDRRTVFRWIREGLFLIDPHEKPRLILGNDLKAFLKAKRESKKVKLQWNEYYCFACRKAVLARVGSEHQKKTGKKIGADNKEQTMLYAKCKDCEGSVARFV